MRASEHEVVIAGGGPTGLMLAGELALAGVDVAIVERRETKDLAGSRAGGLHARSLEVLDQRGIVDRFLAEGQTHSSVGFYVPLDISDFPTRHNYLLALRQERIERLLADWVEDLGVPIHRGSEILSVSHRESGVEVTTSQDATVRAGWLVGCDGGRSVVRKAVGIAFPGWPASTSWLIAEVRMTEPPELGFRVDASGRHAMALREDGETVGVVIAGQDPLAKGVPSLHDLAAALRTIYGTDFGVHAPTWMSRFSDAARQAEAYRNGRVLLAGDAAHIHSPMGGQGLNLGIQDAFNLGWKLAQVAKRVSPEALLDTYQAERHPVAARVLRTTIAQGVLRQPGARTAILGEFVSELLTMEKPRKRFAAMMAALDIRYAPATDEIDEAHPLLGRRVPDLDLGVADSSTRIFTLLHGARPVLLNFGPPGALAVGGWDDRVKVVDARFDGRCELPVLGVVQTPTTILIRPDGHVAWVGDGDAEGLLDALGAWFGDERRSHSPSQSSSQIFGFHR